ncbi:MAG: MYXO-CTERM sorting domain-containing protein [Labilithrix sp.]|nr:MYXO-CTERM sorting domain-containing protein [Labilithrix sp.]MCW5812027.1 MYXO-CTERM sorting domain-containing protein [Labilithrix sp.]
MMRVRFGSALFVVTVLSTRVVLAAQDDCPPGSVDKTEDGFTWCEPSVCLNDSQCNPGYVCVQMPLCMEVGVLSKPGAPDGGSRLIARQMCAEGTCPQNQTCSDLKRCLQRATAERMNKLPGATPSSSATPSPEPKKSSCGCRAAGAPNGPDASYAGLTLAALGAAAFVRRRRHTPP